MSAASKQSPQAMFDEATRLQRGGDPAGAVKVYRKLLRQMPDHPQILYGCGLAQAQTGDFDRAITSLRKSLNKAPDNADGWNNLGLVLQETRKFEDALAAYEKCIELAPTSAVSHTNAGNICQILEQFEAAVSHYKNALEITPEDEKLLGNMTRAQMNLGLWEDTLETAEKSLALSPGDTGTLALKTAVLTELHHDKPLKALLNFDRLVEARPLPVPDKYTDRAEFHKALIDHCFSHHSLTYQPDDRSTSNGHQTKNLSKDEDMGPVADLLEEIRKAVLGYEENHPLDADHPFLARHAKEWKYDIWATALGSTGYHKPHIHRDGWLSGCYYLQIPDVVGAEDGDEAGFIEFGRAPDNPHAKADPRARAYQPEEGMVIFFPSYFYHRTVPFQSDEKRITIAFDIMPLEWEAA